MIKPIDIDHKKFKFSATGYKRKDVDRFMDEVSSTIDGLLEENTYLKAKIRAFDEELKKFRETEKALSDALVLAEETSQTAVKNAMDRAKNIVDEARNKAESIMFEAREELNRITIEKQRAESDYVRFRDEMKLTLENQLKSLTK